ncbi:MAG: hypothetical protein WD645_04995 [Dehalococcoidia bacterium]
MADSNNATDKLVQPTYGVTSEDLHWMVLDRGQLPPQAAAFELLQERELDNEMMAEAFGDRSAESLRAIGRVTGFSRQFAVPQGAPTLAGEPAEILEAATVVHLFDRPENVASWIDDVFVRDTRERVGQDGPNGHRLAGVEILNVSGFHDYAASLLIVHDVPGAILASTVIDFRVGRLLGVAYVVAKQDKAFKDLALDLGLRLERQIVRVILGAS